MRLQLTMEKMENPGKETVRCSELKKPLDDDCDTAARVLELASSEDNPRIRYCQLHNVRIRVSSRHT